MDDILNICIINIIIKNIIDNIMSEKNLKMVFKNQYEILSREQKIELRDEFMRKSGLSLPAFYQKKAKDSFTPLEQKLLNELLEKFK